MSETRRELMCDTCGRGGGDHAVFNLGHPFYNAEAQAVFHGVVSNSPLDIAAIRARCEAATSGPWKAGPTGYVYAADCVTARCGDFRDKELVPFNGERWGNDATFIAHAREDVPALCDALSTAIAERDATLARVDYWRRAFQGKPTHLGVDLSVELECNELRALLSTSQERVRELEARIETSSNIIPTCEWP